MQKSGEVSGMIAAIELATEAAERRNAEKPKLRIVKRPWLPWWQRYAVEQRASCRVEQWYEHRAFMFAWRARRFVRLYSRGQQVLDGRGLPNSFPPLKAHGPRSEAEAMEAELEYAGDTGASLGEVMGDALRKQIIREAEAAPASSSETRPRAAAGSRKPRKSKRTLRVPAPSASKKRPSKAAGPDAHRSSRPTKRAARAVVPAGDRP